MVVPSSNCLESHLLVDINYRPVYRWNSTGISHTGSLLHPLGEIHRPSWVTVNQEDLFIESLTSLMILKIVIMFYLKWEILLNYDSFHSRRWSPSLS